MYPGGYNEKTNSFNLNVKPVDSIENFDFDLCLKMLCVEWPNINVVTQKYLIELSKIRHDYFMQQFIPFFSQLNEYRLNDVLTKFKEIVLELRSFEKEKIRVEIDGFLNDKITDLIAKYESSAVKFFNNISSEFFDRYYEIKIENSIRNNKEFYKTFFDNSVDEFCDFFKNQIHNFKEETDFVS